MRFLLISSLLLFISSCTNRQKDFETASAFAGKVWGMKPAKIELIEQDDQHTSGEIQVTILDLSLAKGEQKAEDLASIAAMAFVQNVDPAKCVGFEKISIHFDWNGKAHHSDYTISEVRDATNLAVSVSEFLSTPYDKGIDGLKMFVDGNMMPDSVLLQYRSGMLQSDSLYGITSMSNVTGMRMTEVKDTGEPVVVFNSVSHKEGGDLPLSFYVSRKSGKIVSIGPGL